MNPIWQVYLHGNMSDQGAPEPNKRNRKKRQAQREKLRQEKEQRRAEAVERDIQRYKEDHEGNDAAEPHVEEHNDHEESAAERFQKELCWCIQQLETGLQNLKPSAKQAEEAKKLLRTLKSTKAPMAKKRQVMRMTFGDYRTKMAKEEKKNAAAMKKSFLEPAAAEKQTQAKFYRKSTSAVVSPRLSSGRGPPGGSELSTVLEADSSEESVTSLERHCNEMTLSEDAQSLESPTKQHQDLNHCPPSCSQMDHDSLSLRSSPSGASTSSSTSFPAVLLNVNQQPVDSKQSFDLNDSDHSDAPKTNFCFNFEIEPDDIDQGPPAKKPAGRENKVGNQSAKQSSRDNIGGNQTAKQSSRENKTSNQSPKLTKEDTGSSEGSPKIGDLAEKKGSNAKKGRRRKSKKKQQQQDKLEEMVDNKTTCEKQELVENKTTCENQELVENKTACENQELDENKTTYEEQEVSSTGSGGFMFNFPEPSSAS